MSRKTNNNVYQLNIKKFDPTKIRKGSTMIFVGKRNTGKSFLVRNILYYLRDIPMGIVKSGSESANPFFSNFVPRAFIHDDYDSEIMSNIFDRQIKIIKKNKRELELYGRSSIDTNAFVVLDDLMFDTSWVTDRQVTRTFMNGRHYNITFMVTMQYPLGIPPRLRGNVDYVFLLREPEYAMRKKLYEQYGGIFPNFNAFCQAFNNCSENYECMVIDRTSRSNNIEDIIHWYKADETPNFKIGAQYFWELNDQYLNDDDDINDNYADINDMSSDLGRGPTININKI